MFTEKYSKEEMTKAFDLVKNAENWKDPISKVVNVDEKMLDVIYEAVIYFTGSAPEFIHTKKGIRVVASGYYNTVGA